MSEEEKKIHAEKAALSKNISEYAKLNDIPVSTLYRWINKFYHCKRENRNRIVQVVLTEDEYNLLMKKHKQFGYQNSLSSLIRTLIFKNKIFIFDDANKVSQVINISIDLRRGFRNLNQIAKYYNFLGRQKVIDESRHEELYKELNMVYSKAEEISKLLQKILKRV